MVSRLFDIYDWARIHTTHTKFKWRGRAEFFFFNKQESILLVFNHKNAMSSEVKGREDNWFALGLGTEKICGK